MKIAIGYPPIDHKKNLVPLLSQNRQFQWAVGGPVSYAIFPVVMASAATMLRAAGHEVFWLDGIAEKWSFQKWLSELEKAAPDILVMETKTPVIKEHWEIIKKIRHRSSSPLSGPSLVTVLVGDHVTALPEESMEKSAVDYILTGGDYDFLLINLVNHLTHGKELESGIWYRKKSKIKNQKSKTQLENKNYQTSGRFCLNHDLDSLPLIDRELTKWRLYAYKNSNFYEAPGAYTMFGRDCWWGQCAFCSWTTLYPGKAYRKFSVKKALDEIESLIKKYHVKEIMDDSGTFPTGGWLSQFCQGMIKRGYHKKIKFSANMRFNSDLTQNDYKLMGQAGFRLLLYGLESANQKTLDRLNKNLKVETIEKVLLWAKKAGLSPHLTVMVGYPWEKEKDINYTIGFVEKIFRKGLADSLQATLIVPYPGTPLFSDCQKNGLLKTVNWDRYDMTTPIIKAPVSDKVLFSAIRSLYSRSIGNPHFIFKSFCRLFSFAGIKYVGFQTLKYFAKLVEFR